MFSLAHEFKSTDTMRKAVERNGYPWPCLVDRDGTIIAVPNSVEELKTKLVEIFGE